MHDCTSDNFGQNLKPKKMKNYKVLSVFFAFLMGSVCLMSSCKDDDETLGLIGSWNITAAVFNPPLDTNGTDPGGEVTDAYSLFFQQPCDQDDLFIFEEGGVYKNDEGPTKCDTSDPQFTPGTYTHVGSTITLIEGTDTTVFNNATITNSTLTGTAAVNVGGGTVATIDFTMDRQ
jgi:hypothetical protein